MAHIVYIEGIEEIKAKLKAANIRLGTSVRKGLIRAGYFLQRKSQQIVPIKTSTLKNSAGTRALGGGWRTDVQVYYTASYAVYVHEMTDLKHAPGKEAKFLEKPAREYRDEILNLIAKGAGEI